jgi:preprotein translocase subunit SecE
MSFLINYFKSSYVELRKVVWPDRQEVTKIAFAIMAFALILALLMWLYDSFFGWVIYNLILTWR